MQRIDLDFRDATVLAPTALDTAVTTATATCRVFFAEFLKSDLFLQEDEMALPLLVTPTSARCNRLFGVGEVKEVERRGKILKLKITDSTAILEVYTERTIWLDEGEVKVNRKRKIEGDTIAMSSERFLAFNGNVHVRDKSPNFILAEEIGAVGADVRDCWILDTAYRTMERIEHLRINLQRSSLPEKEKRYSEKLLPDQIFLKETKEHYALDDEKLDLFAHTALNAVERIGQRICRTKY